MSAIYRDIDIETERQKTEDRKVIRQKMMNSTQKTSRRPQMTGRSKQGDGEG